MSIEKIFFYFISPTLIASLTSILITFIFNYTQSGFKEINERISHLNALKNRIQQDSFIVELITKNNCSLNDSKNYLSNSLSYNWLDYQTLDKPQSDLLLIYNKLLLEIKLLSPDDELLDFKLKNFLKFAEDILKITDISIDSFYKILNSKIQVIPFLIYYLKSDYPVKK